MLTSLSIIPPDPILNVTVACRQDPNPNKVDLGVGVYRTEDGQVKVMDAIAQAAKEHQQQLSTYTYVNPPGNPVFLEHFPTIALGNTDAPYTAVASNSGTGALNLLGNLIKLAQPDTTLWLPKPTWGNHHAVFASCGLTIKEFPYYDKTTHQVTFEPMMEALKKLGPNDVVLLHGSCQNPAGADPSPQQWEQIGDLALQQGFNILVDVAYQGLGAGLEQDAYGVRHLASKLPRLFVAQSAAKIFGVYGLRTGAAIVCAQNEDERTKAFGNLNKIARAQYSMSSSYGAELVGRVLSDETKKTVWQNELESMGERIRSLRAGLANGVNEKIGSDAFSFITKEYGMFSFLGFSPEQMVTLREKHSIYGLNSGRINVAGLNQNNLQYVIDGVADVVKS